MGLPRVTPKGGATICGKFVPENVSSSLIIRLHVNTDDTAIRPSWRFTSGPSTTTRNISKTHTDSTPRGLWGMKNSHRITGRLSNLSTLAQEIAWGGIWPMLK
ncbi:hypothetical protein CaCOL14_008382 [Colletotrichum acutatum]